MLSTVSLPHILRQELVARNVRAVLHAGGAASGDGARGGAGDGERDLAFSGGVLGRFRASSVRKSAVGEQ